jgi:hypothetical protein
VPLHTPDKAGSAADGGSYAGRGGHISIINSLPKTHAPDFFNESVKGLRDRWPPARRPHAFIFLVWEIGERSCTSLQALGNSSAEMLASLCMRLSTHTESAPLCVHIRTHSLCRYPLRASIYVRTDTLHRRTLAACNQLPLRMGIYIYRVSDTGYAPPDNPRPCI